MSSQTNKELWKSWSELWNGNLSIADEIIAPNFVAYFAPIGNSPAEVHGPDELKQWISATGAAFTETSFTTTVGPLVDQDKVAGRWVFRATYGGGMPGASPTAVGKRVEYAGMDLFRVEAGKIVEYWLCADTLHLLQQIGVIPS
jgi:predicted ester cyclase